MLSLPWMGLLALAAFWVNVVLIAMAAWKSLGALSVRRHELAQRALLHATVVQGRGDGGAFARRTVEQVGRAMTTRGPRRILFVDAKDAHEVLGGTVRVEDATREITTKPDALLWSEPSRCVRVASTDFERAWSEASTSRGVRTSSTKVVGPAEKVWLLLDASGEVELVATMDPQVEVARGMRVLWLLMLITLVPALAITALILTPPVFGPLSTLGGLLALAFFLAIQPVAVELQDRARLPNAQRVGGVWREG